MSKLTQVRQLTLEGARIIATAAEAEAARHGWLIAVAVVDAGGHPLYLSRMETALIASWRGALNKATTAIQFGRPTKMLEEAVARGKLHYFAFDDVLPVQGGFPIEIDGQIVGGVGVGGSPGGEQAAQCAQAGIAALMAA